MTLSPIKETTVGRKNGTKEPWVVTIVRSANHLHWEVWIKFENSVGLVLTPGSSISRTQYVCFREDEAHYVTFNHIILIVKGRNINLPSIIKNGPKQAKLLLSILRKYIFSCESNSSIYCHFSSLSHTFCQSWVNYDIWLALIDKVNKIDLSR